MELKRPKRKRGSKKKKSVPAQVKPVEQVKSLSHTSDESAEEQREDSDDAVRLTTSLVERMRFHYWSSPNHG
jgi:hypothetical protein